MAGPKKEVNPSRNGTDGAVPAQGGSSNEMSQDWLARLRESDSGWDEPAFPERFSKKKANRGTASAPVQETAMSYESQADEEARSLPFKVIFVLLGLIGLAWLAAVVWSIVDPAAGQRVAPVLITIATLSGPLVLIVGLAILLLSLRRPAGASPALMREDAQEIANQAAQAAARLGETQSQLLSHTRDFASAADQSAAAILGTVHAVSTQSAQLEQSTSTSMAALASLGERIAAMTDALPRLEDRLATLAETLARVGGDLGHRQETLDQQLQSTALVAEEARIQLVDASKLLADQLGGLRDGARQAGDELANLSELSSARIDLTLDRVKSVMASTEQRIEAQNQSLTQLIEASRTGIDGAAGHSLNRFGEHCRKVEELLSTLDARLTGQSEKSGAWLEDMSRGVAALAGEFNALEQSALARSETLSTTMTRLSDETKRLVAALDTGHEGSDQLIRRAESLLTALDSGVRELDESIPNAMGRVEARLETLHERIRSANPGIEAVEAVAAGVVSQLHESDQLAKSHVAALTDALQKSQAALAAQKQQIDGLAAAVAQASDGMSRLGETVGPQMVEALVRVRETADAAAARARAAITGVIPEAASQLGEASGAAVEQAIAKSVSEQLERLSLVADDAVKAAHRATDKLTRQMLSLTDASKTLEGTLSTNSDRIEGQDRELMAQRSAKLIATLNERAIDVNKWLDRDISDADWSAYLKGDQGLFARRATRLVAGGDAKHIHALYNEDADFREHVNRYVHDFEGLLRTVMATKDGSTLALTMVSSDIGKLYVALAQAIERLRSH